MKLDTSGERGLRNEGLRKEESTKFLRQMVEKCVDGVHTDSQKTVKDKERLAGVHMRWGQQ